MTQTLYHGHVSSLDRSKTLGWHLSQCFRGLGRLRILPLGLSVRHIIVLIMCDLNLEEYCAEQVVEEVLVMHGSPVISDAFQLRNRRLLLCRRCLQRRSGTCTTKRHHRQGGHTTIAQRSQPRASSDVLRHTPSTRTRVVD